MSESWLMESEKKLFNYVKHFNSKCDLVDENGVVYTHIKDYKNKNRMKKIAMKFKIVFPKIKLKRIENRDYKGKIVAHSLYGDIWSFYTVPYSICFLESSFHKESKECKKCSYYQKCIKLSLEVLNKN